ncbi:MAG: leucine-rich repeat protein [Oscillospiraceae bacterium]|nr:leucine-rich repeat protein [Oscillospiraceae bacterium]
MKKMNQTKRLRSVLMVLVAAALIFGAVAAPHAQASDYEASYIKPLQGVEVDYSQFVDSSVMYRLPDGVSSEQEISVIVTVDVPDLMTAYEASDKSVSFREFALFSKEAADITARIHGQKAAYLAALEEKGIAYTAGKDYNTVLSGFEILIRGGDYEAACASLGEGSSAFIGEEYRIAETQLVENKVNVYSTGIFNSEGCGYDGTGMVVAVLDTGLDSNHSAFSLDNFTSDRLGLTYDEVAALLGQTTASTLVDGLGVDDVYINTKVPFGFDYADSDPDPYSTHNNHGTHVSGIIVGKDDTITGVAPNAQVIAMKVFSDVVDTARTAWILSALEDCVVLGVDVINMSLGTACGFSSQSEEEAVNGVYEKIRQSGISLVVAASNSYSSAYGSEKNGNLGLTSNPDTGTVGSPGTYAGALSVASIEGAETPYLLYEDTIIYFDEATNGASKELDFCETLLGDKNSVEIEFVLIPGVGRSADYTGMDVAGKIALVRRGSNTFEEKAIIAEAQGAAGIIIYNNVSGDIKMNVGDAALAVCSITQDDGEMLAGLGSGKLTISREQTSGPFMTDFSSWGPTPDLKLKPDITAHGGNILSSITGGGYDRLSGTSMACPNLAGMILLLRQYVVENFPAIAGDNVAVSDMVNRLMMSTADIVLNKNGLPYSVRKQGAGLANLDNCLTTPAYITTYGADGAVLDRTKLELGDDKEKTGVYEMKFAVNNFGENSLTYNIGGYVMTEGVSDTKTNAGETTVTEQAYILEGASLEVKGVQGGSLSGTKLTVEAGKTADVTVVLTLSDADKAYLDASFENGMYVEGYITLTAEKGTEVDMGVPYLAFYGDWTVAPLLDLEYFDTHADELDDAIDEEDKVKADAYASRPIGGVESDYVSYLGTYYFLQNPKDIVISANKDYISLSNREGAIHTLRFVWAGLLRNAATVDVTITDDATGEVVFTCQDTDVRKSYGDGGASIFPAQVEIEFDVAEENLMNNSKYTVRLVCTLDYEDGGLETNEKNVFEFPLTVDFEAPTVTGVEYYYEYDKTMDKNRLYAKIGIYDNHYAMSAQVGYVAAATDSEGNSTAEMKTFDQFLTPVYSQEDSVTYVTYELTDHIFELKENAMNDNSFVVTCYDYALNYATYEIGLPAEYADFYFDGLEEGITLSPNEVYSLEPLVQPDTAWSELLEYTSSRPSVARIVNNKVVAASSGSAVVKVRDPQTNKSMTFKVTVLAEGDEGYHRYDKPVADIFRLDGYYTNKAYYMIDNEEKDLGDTGNTRFFEGGYDLSMYPSESVTLNYTLDAYFPNDTKVEFESSNENIVKIDESGKVTAVAEGFASVTVKVMMDGRSTYYSESVSVEVKDPYVTTGAILTHYYGNGGLVSIPADLSLTEIGGFAFSNFDYVEKTPEELEHDDAETMKQWYIGENTVTKVVIPEGVEKINQYAFANLTALEEVILPSTLESIEYGAFYGCTALEKITFSGENNLKIINQHAFENCDLQGTLELPSICVISDYAFAGNQKLKGLTTSDTLLSIGQYAFAGCKALKDVTIGAEKVKYAAYCFTDCEVLTEFYVNAAVLPEGMFYECRDLAKVSIGPDVNSIGQYAFRSTAVSEFTVTGGSAYKAQTADHILSADGKTLVAVAPVLEGAYTNDSVTAVGKGAFSHNMKLTSAALPNVTVVAEYGFSSCDRLAELTLGELTSVGDYAFFEVPITQLPAFTAQTPIGKYAFAYTNLKSVTVPSGMHVAEGVFSECAALEEVIIGDDVTLDQYAFGMNKDEAFRIIGFDDAGGRRFRYEFYSALKNLTIGKNAVIGKRAFTNAACLETVTLGENAQIGEMAFYNNTMLQSIDLSKAVSIGNYAFSGDEYYICLDDSMTVSAVSPEGQYMTTTHASALTEVDLSSATGIGEYAFALCEKLTNVVLGESITRIPQYAFARCTALQQINLDKVTSVGEYAFRESALQTVDLSAAEELEGYAFVDSKALTAAVLNPAGMKLGEGAFAYCAALTDVQNLSAVTEVGSYGFAYAGLTGADLSAAVTVGDQAFMKEELTPFRVVLGTALTSVGDNPFAMCVLEPFRTENVTNFNGVDYTDTVYTFQASENIFVIDGSLYCATPKGLELTVYAGEETKDVKVADGTVRITAMAFAGSGVEMVTLPYTVESIGHKAFFGCDKLQTVVFNSYDAPTLEEEFDPAYYECFEHIPGTGDYGDYTDYDGNDVTVLGTGMLPYYMWNATDGMYSNVFYGANFVDYVGYVENKLTMVRPVNGKNYDSYIYGQYFDRFIDGASAADDVTLAAIAAIDSLPERVTYEHKALVEAARAAYSSIATTEQQALVKNYAELISAEQRIIALTPTEEAPVEDPAAPGDEGGNGGVGAAVAIGAALIASCGAVGVAVSKKRKGAQAEAPAEEAAEEAAEEVTEEISEEVAEEPAEETEA